MRKSNKGDEKEGKIKKEERNVKRRKKCKSRTGQIKNNLEKEGKNRDKDISRDNCVKVRKIGKIRREKKKERKV